MLYIVHELPHAHSTCLAVKVVQRRHIVLYGEGGVQHLVRHVVQEGRLHPVALLSLFVGNVQFLATLLEGVGQFVQLVDVGRYRALHFLEVALQHANLVVVRVSLGERLIIVPLSYSLGELSQRLQRFQSVTYDEVRVQTHQHDAHDGNNQHIVE